MFCDASVSKPNRREVSLCDVGNEAPLRALYSYIISSRVTRERAENFALAHYYVTFRRCELFNRFRAIFEKENLNCSRGTFALFLSLLIPSCFLSSNSDYRVSRNFPCLLGYMSRLWPVNLCRSQADYSVPKQKHSPCVALTLPWSGKP